MDEDDSDEGRVSDQPSDRKSGEQVLYWTRVVQSGQKVGDSPDVFEINKDLRQEKVLKQVRDHIAPNGSSFFFDPDFVKKNTTSFNLFDYQLDTDGLYNYARVASDIRNRIKCEVQIEKSNTFIGQQAIHPLQNAKIDGSNREHSLKMLKQNHEDMPGERIIGDLFAPQKRQKRCQLSTNTLLEIAQTAQRGDLSHNEIGLSYGVSTRLVSTLSSEFKRNKCCFAKRASKEAKQHSKASAIKIIVAETLAQNADIWRIEDVRKDVLSKFKLDVSRQLVTDVLKGEFAMKYRRVKKIPFQGNSDRCKVLRMLYSKVMLGLLAEGKRIVNIDETWLPLTDYRTFKWRKKNTRNSRPLKTIAHRVNLIAAMDTDGRVFYSLTQASTTSSIVMLFISKLSNLLSRSSSNWKENTVFLLDGASYHRAQDTRSLLQNLGIQVVLSAPYCYDAAPCELLFAHLKRGDWNPCNVKTGKRLKEQKKKNTTVHCGKLRKMKKCGLCGYETYSHWKRHWERNHKEAQMHSKNHHFKHSEDDVQHSPTKKRKLFKIGDKLQETSGYESQSAQQLVQHEEKLRSCLKSGSHSPDKTKRVNFKLTKKQIRKDKAIEHLNQLRRSANRTKSRQKKNTDSKDMSNDVDQDSEVIYTGYQDHVSHLTTSQSNEIVLQNDFNSSELLKDNDKFSQQSQDDEQGHAQFEDIHLVEQNSIVDEMSQERVEISDEEDRNQILADFERSQQETKQEFQVELNSPDMDSELRTELNVDKSSPLACNQRSELICSTPMAFNSHLVEKVLGILEQIGQLSQAIRGQATENGSFHNYFGQNSKQDLNTNLVKSNRVDYQGGMQSREQLSMNQQNLERVDDIANPCDSGLQATNQNTAFKFTHQMPFCPNFMLSDLTLIAEPTDLDEFDRPVREKHVIREGEWITTIVNMNMLSANEEELVLFLNNYCCLKQKEGLKDKQVPSMNKLSVSKFKNIRLSQNIGNGVQLLEIINEGKAKEIFNAITLVLTALENIHWSDKTFVGSVTPEDIIVDLANETVIFTNWALSCDEKTFFNRLKIQKPYYKSHMRAADFDDLIAHDLMALQIIINDSIQVLNGNKNSPFYKLALKEYFQRQVKDGYFSKTISANQVGQSHRVIRKSTQMGNDPYISTYSELKIN